MTSTTLPVAEAGASVALYRAGYGDYPEYFTGSVPSAGARFSTARAVLSTAIIVVGAVEGVAHQLAEDEVLARERLVYDDDPRAVRSISSRFWA